MKRKKVVVALLALAFIGVSALALKLKAAVVFYGYLTNETALAYSQNYALDLNTLGANSVSAQVSISSSVLATQRFTDGTQSTGTITVSSYTALSKSRATGTITISSNAALGGSYATNTISVASNSFVVALGTSMIVGIGDGVHFASYTAILQWDTTSTSTGTAVKLAKLLNGSVYGISASTTGTGSTVTITATQYGTYANSYVLYSSSQTRLTVGSPTFSGGTDPVDVAVKDILFRANANFTVTDTSTGTAVNLKNLINAEGSLAPLMTATTVSNTVLITAVSTGSSYVYQLYSSSQAALTVSGVSSTTWVSGSTISLAGISGGRDSATLLINGVILREGLHWFVGASSQATAQSISSAIVNTANGVYSVVQSSWAGNVIYTTTTINGVASKYRMYTSTQAALTLSNSPTAIAGGAAYGTLAGGTDIGYNITTDIITIASHTLTLGFPVLYSTGGVSIGGLVNQTTYYAIPITSGTFYLSRTSTDAVAGSFIDLTSSSTQVSSHTFTLTPLGVTGAASVKWQTSNDSSNWFDIAATSTSLVTPYTSTTTYVNLGTVPGRYLRAAYTAPTTGGVSTSILINLKN